MFELMECQTCLIKQCIAIRADLKLMIHGIFTFIQIEVGMIRIGKQRILFCCSAGNNGNAVFQQFIRDGNMQCSRISFFVISRYIGKDDLIFFHLCVKDLLIKTAFTAMIGIAVIIDRNMIFFSIECECTFTDSICGTSDRCAKICIMTDIVFHAFIPFRHIRVQRKIFQ